MHGGFGGGGGGFGHSGGYSHGGGGHVSHHSGFGDSGHHHVHAPGGHDSSSGQGGSFLQHALGMVHNGAGILGHLAQALTGHHATHHAGSHSGGEPQNVMNWTSSIQVEKTDEVANWTRRIAKDPGIKLLLLFAGMLAWVFVVHYINHHDPVESHPMDNATWRRQLTLGQPGGQEAQLYSAAPDSGAPLAEEAGPSGQGVIEPSAGLGSLLGGRSLRHVSASAGGRSQRLFGARQAQSEPGPVPPETAQPAVAPNFGMSTMPESEPNSFQGFGAPRQLEAAEYAAAAPIVAGQTVASAPPLQPAAYGSYAAPIIQPGMFGQPGAPLQTQAPTPAYTSPPVRHARSTSHSQFIPPPPPMTPSGLVPPPPPLAMGEAGAVAGMYNFPAAGGSDYNGASSGRNFRKRVVTER